ncbi:MAG: DUF1854 domain-containing protein [Ruminococcaceae bacterium]|nr:DUF1854 domain-containing protein [Oscillospiraceae bacterium]
MAEQEKKQVNESAKSDKKEEKKVKNDILGDGSDDGDLILENERVSIDLTMENAKFSRSGGGLISLEITNADGEKEFFERVVILRSFPVTNPSEFLSVRQPDSKKQGRGKEIGMIRRMSDFDEASQALFLEELDRRYFTPQIAKIITVKEKFGYLYWDVITTAGSVTFVMNNPFSNIRILEDGRILINDIDGNIFEIHDPAKLDAASLKKIEIYL